MNIDLNTNRTFAFGGTNPVSDAAALAPQEENAMKTNDKGLTISNAPASLAGIESQNLDVPSRTDALGKLFSRAFDFVPPPMPQFV